MRTRAERNPARVDGIKPRCRIVTCIALDRSPKDLSQAVRRGDVCGIGWSVRAERGGARPVLGHVVGELIRRTLVLLDSKKATKMLFLTGRLYARSLVQSSTVGWSDSGGIFSSASMAGHVQFAFLRQLHRRTYLSMVFRSVLLAAACARGDFAILCMRSHISLCVLVGSVPFS